MKSLVIIEIMEMKIICIKWARFIKVNFIWFRLRTAGERDGQDHLCRLYKVGTDFDLDRTANRTYGREISAASMFIEDVVSKMFGQALLTTTSLTSPTLQSDVFDKAGVI